MRDVDADDDVEVDDGPVVASRIYIQFLVSLQLRPAYSLSQENEIMIRDLSVVHAGKT